MKDNGIDKVFADLDALDKNLRNKVIRKGQRAGAKILAAEIRATAPVHTGLIKRSVKVRAGKRTKNTTSVGVVIASGNDLYYIGFNEFGTKHQTANPFIRRAVEAKRAEVFEAVGEAVEVEIHNGHWVKSRGIST